MLLAYVVRLQSQVPRSGNSRDALHSGRRVVGTTWNGAPMRNQSRDLKMAPVAVNITRRSATKELNTRIHEE